jgi:hypothetical protein
VKKKSRKPKRNPIFDFAADPIARSRFDPGLDLLALAADQYGPWTGPALASLVAVFAGDDDARVTVVSRLHRPLGLRQFRTGVDAVRWYACAPEGDLVVDDGLVGWVDGDPLRRLQAWLLLGWGFGATDLVDHVAELDGCADPASVPVDLWDVSAAADELRAAGAGPWNEKLVRRVGGSKDESSWEWLGRLSGSVGIDTADVVTRLDVALGVLAAGLAADDRLAGHIALKRLVRSKPDQRVSPTVLAQAVQRNAGLAAGRLAGWLDSHWEGGCAQRRPRPDRQKQPLQHDGDSA